MTSFNTSTPIQDVLQDELGPDSSTPTSLEVPLEVLHAIHQLPEDEANLETERADEMIKQKIRPFFKLNNARRNVDQVRSYEDSAAESSQAAPVSTEVFTSDDDDTVARPSTKSRARDLPIQMQRASIYSSMGGDDGSESGIASVSGSVMGSISKAKQKFRKLPKTDTQLIEIEEPRLIDAQTAIDDRRYFRRPDDPEPEGDFVYDFLYQHQRGAFFLGTPRFSSKSLLPVDPDEWTNEHFETSAMDTSNYGLPDPGWEWVHKSWLVDMTGDVDEDGWEYAMTFHGSPWHGNYEVFRSFARRRRWLRLRKRKNKSLGKPGPLPERTYPESIHSATWAKLDKSPSLPDHTSPFPHDERPPKHASDKSGPSGLSMPPSHPEPVDLYKVLKKACSDREKLAYTAQYVVRHPGNLEDLETHIDRYLNLLDYEASRREFLSLLVAYGRTKQDAILAAEHLEYYSDQKLLLSKIAQHS
ncbi:hypothetical protein BGZ50_005831 [Haplosporangium sp. Z 11]|nr:hypothetical protein BGZ50_005831 [Haplosporangium sp. Z 11]